MPKKLIFRTILAFVAMALLLHGSPAANSKTATADGRATVVGLTKTQIPVDTGDAEPNVMIDAPELVGSPKRSASISVDGGGKPTIDRRRDWWDWKDKAKKAWKVTKCVSAITIAIASTAFAASKILKIKKLVKSAGGVKKTAGKVIKAFKKKGSLSTKAKAGFGDLGKGSLAVAVLILDIDTIQSNCK